MDNRFRYRR